MLAVSCPQLRVVRDRIRGDQGVGDLDAMAPPVSLQISTSLTAHFLVDGSTSQCPEKVAESVILAWARAGLEFRHTNG